MMHLIFRHPSGPIQSSPFVLVTGEQAPGSGQSLLIACDPTRDHITNMMVTDEPHLVDCPQCIATEYFKSLDPAVPKVQKQHIPSQALKDLRR